MCTHIAKMMYGMCIPYILVGIMFGGLLEKGRKLQLADINLAVTVRSPRLLHESTQLAQYWWI